METLFDLAAENAEKQISSDRLRPKKARKEDVDFLHDQKKARKMQMSALDYESRAKWQRKRQREEIENRIKQASTNKKDAENAIDLQSSSHSEVESETSGKECSPCTSKRRHTCSETISVQLPKKILRSEKFSQVADREGLSSNHYFAVVASMIDASSGNLDDFVISPSTGRRSRASNRTAISTQIKQNFVSP